MKAILVVDIPDDWNCKEWCIEGELRGKNEEGPLKPMPQKQEMAQEPYICNNDWQNGWNDCLEEIEKC